MSDTDLLCDSVQQGCGSGYHNPCAKRIAFGR